MIKGLQCLLEKNKALLDEHKKGGGKFKSKRRGEKKTEDSW